MRSFSTKCSALGFLNTSQCLVMGMAFFQLTNANTQYYFSEYLLRSEGNKTVQHASFFIPSSMFITPGFAKISIRIDSFILLWWKWESNAKNDSWSHPITWSGFCFKCCQKSCFYLGLKYIFCVVFLIHPTIVMFPQCNNKNSLGKAPGNRHSFSLSIFWVRHWTEIALEFFLS